MASIVAGGQRTAAQPPVLWGKPCCPGSAHHPLLPPEYSRSLCPPWKNQFPSPVPCHRALLSTKGEHRRTSLPGWDRPHCNESQGLVKKGELLPWPCKPGFDAADPLPARLTQRGRAWVVPPALLLHKDTGFSPALIPKTEGEMQRCSLHLSAPIRGPGKLQAAAPDARPGLLLRPATACRRPLS